MEIDIIPIGNSRGIRIPKAVLESVGLEDRATLHQEDDRLIIAPLRTRREGWDVAMAKMAANGDDVLLDEVAADHSFDQDEWEW